MKKTIKQKCKNIYESKGAQAVHDFLIDNSKNIRTESAFCKKCNAESEFIDDECLICGSVNDESKNKIILSGKPIAGSLKIIITNKKTGMRTLKEGKDFIVSGREISFLEKQNPAPEILLENGHFQLNLEKTGKKWWLELRKIPTGSTKILIFTSKAKAKAFVEGLTLEQVIKVFNEKLKIEETPMYKPGTRLTIH